MKKIVCIDSLLFFLFSACKDSETVLPNSGLCDNTDYTYSDVKYIFENKYVGIYAYGGQAVAAGDFSPYQGIEVTLTNALSTFLSQIRWEMSGSDYNMLPTEKLSDEELQKLECWIEAGYLQ